MGQWKQLRWPIFWSTCLHKSILTESVNRNSTDYFNRHFIFVCKTTKQDDLLGKHASSYRMCIIDHKMSNEFASYLTLADKNLQNVAWNHHWMVLKKSNASYFVFLISRLASIRSSTKIYLPHIIIPYFSGIDTRILWSDALEPRYKKTKISYIWFLFKHPLNAYNFIKILI